MSRLKANLLLLLTAVIWGSTFTVTKFVTDVFSPYFIIAIRFTLATLALLGPALARRNQWKAGYWSAGLWMGITLCVGYLLQTVGLSMDTVPGKSAFLTAIYCILVPFLYWIFFKTKPQANHLVAAGIFVVGIGFISLSGSGFGLTAGDGVILLGGVACAMNIVVTAHFSKGRDSLLITTIQLGVVAVAAWCLVFLTKGIPAASTPFAIGGTIYLGLIATALCLLMQTVGIKYTSPTLAAILLSLESVFGVVFSVLFYHENLTPRMCIGFVLVFGAVLLAQYTPAKSRVSQKKKSESLASE